MCHAIDIGYRHLDCALAYENEDGIGRAIADKIKQGVLSRDDLFVTSKVGQAMHRYARATGNNSCLL